MEYRLEIEIQLEHNFPIVNYEEKWKIVLKLILPTQDDLSDFAFILQVFMFFQKYSGNPLIWCPSRKYLWNFEFYSDLWPVERSNVPSEVLQIV